MENLFIKATQQKLRFESSAGYLTVEDLWDLPLTSNVGKASLDQVGMKLVKKTSNDTIASLVDGNASSASESELMALEIVKYIIQVKKEQNKARLEEADKKQKRQQLMSLLEQKRNEELSQMSKEDIIKELENL